MMGIIYCDYTLILFGMKGRDFRMGAHFRMKHWIFSVMWVCVALQKVVPFIKRVHIPQCNVMNRRHGTCACQDATESQCAQSADPIKSELS